MGGNINDGVWPDCGKRLVRKLSSAAIAGTDTLLIPEQGLALPRKPAGIPVPKLGVPVFSATMKLEFYDVGLTPYGAPAGLRPAIRHC